MHVARHARGFEDRGRPHDVEIDRFAGRAGDVVDIRHGREVEDGVAAGECTLDLGQAGDIARLPGDIRTVRRRAIEDADGVAGLYQLVDDMASDESRATSYSDVHAFTPAGISCAIDSIT